jgi:hypothetical protein
VLVVLGLAAPGAFWGCRAVRQDEALAILDVSAQAPVPAFTTFCFSVATRPEVRTHELPAPSSRRMTFGYYLPGPSGRVQIRAQALAPSGQVVGEGLADVDIQLGRISATVTLAMGAGSISAARCAKGDASADAPPGDAVGDGQSDGPADAPADGRPDAALDGQPDTTADAELDLAGDGRAEAAADALADLSTADGTSDTAADAPITDGSAADVGVPPCTACVPGATRGESESCGPCGTGRRSRTLTCSTTCTWTGAWDACLDPGTADHGCSVVDWCTRNAAPECRQLACSTAEALAECRAEAKTVCGTNSRAPTIANCN